MQVPLFPFASAARPRLTGDSVPNEISSNPKSFPPKTVCKSTIEIDAEVAGPEFHVP